MGYAMRRKKEIAMLPLGVVSMSQDHFVNAPVDRSREYGARGGYPLLNTKERQERTKGIQKIKRKREGRRVK